MNGQNDRKPPEISSGRKTLYYAGLGMMVLGGILCVVGFITFANEGNSAFNSFGIMPMNSGMPRGFVISLIGMLLLVAGAFVRGIGARGAAGSGLVLDPEKAREDLHPYTHMAGGMVKDAVDAFKGDDSQPATKEIIRVRCPHCKALNDENDKYCGQCGKAI